MFPELFAMFQKHLNSPSMAMWALLKASEKKLGEVTYSGVCENVVIHPVGRTLNQALNEAARGFDAAVIQQNSMPYGVEVMADTSGDEEEINYDEEILEKDEEINYDEEILEDQEELSDEEEKDTTEIEEHTDGKIENTKQQQNEVLSAFFR